MTLNQIKFNLYSSDQKYVVIKSFYGQETYGNLVK